MVFRIRAWSSDGGPLTTVLHRDRNRWEGAARHARMEHLASINLTAMAASEALPGRRSWKPSPTTEEYVR
jgi:hypothetical protein